MQRQKNIKKFTIFFYQIQDEVKDRLINEVAKIFYERYKREGEERKLTNWQEITVRERLYGYHIWHNLSDEESKKIDWKKLLIEMCEEEADDFLARQVFTIEVSS